MDLCAGGLSYYPTKTQPCSKGHNTFICKFSLSALRCFLSSQMAPKSTSTMLTIPIIYKNDAKMQLTGEIGYPIIMHIFCRMHTIYYNNMLDNKWDHMQYTPMKAH